MDLSLVDRHISARICQDGPELLPTLFNGLIWRSRVTEHGLRRVNYFIKRRGKAVNGKFQRILRGNTI